MRGTRLRLRILAIFLLGLGGWGPASAAARQEAGAEPTVTAEAPVTRQFYAVVIGVQDHEDVGVPDAPGAQDDAARVSAWLRRAHPQEWARQGLLEILEVGGRDRLDDPADSTVRLRPTRENLTDGLTRWLSRRIRPGDVLFVYFTGHALAMPIREGAMKGMQEYVLLPSDVRPGAAVESGVNLAAVFDRTGGNDGLAKRLRDCTIISVLDTSLQGRGPGGFQPADWPEGFKPDSKGFLSSLTTWGNRMAWLAADETPSGVIEEGPRARGLLTLAMLEALGDPTSEELTGGLTSVLDRLRSSEALARQGFASRGTVAPGLGPRPRELRPPVIPDPELVLQRGHAALVSQWGVLPDRSLLITGSDDSSIRLWDPGDGSVRRILSDHEIRVTALAVSGDGRYLASGDGRGNLRVYDLQRLAALPISTSMKRHRAGISQVAFVPGPTLQVVSRDVDLRVVRWDLTEGRYSNSDLNRNDSGGDLPGPCTHVLVPGEGQELGALYLLEVGGRLWRCDWGGRMLGSQELTADPVICAELAPDGTRLMIGGRSGTVEVHDLKVEPSKVGSWLMGGRVQAVGWLGSQRAAVHTLAPGGSRGWLLDLAAPQSAATELAGRLARFAYSRDGRWLAGSTTRGEISLWRVDEQGRPRACALEKPGAEPLASTGAPTLAFEQGWLLAGDLKGGVQVWELPGDEGGEQAAFRLGLPSARGAVKRVRVDATGRWLLQITTDGLACLWDLEDGAGPRVLGQRFDSGGFREDGPGLLMSLESDAPERPGQVVWVDLEGRMDPLPFALPEGGEVLSFSLVTVSPDGRWVAASTSDEERTVTEGHAQVCVWEVATGRLAHVIDDHPLGVLGIAFSADGRRLATVSEDGMACVRDLEKPGALVVENGRFQLTGRPGEPPESLHAVAFDPLNGDRIVVGSGTGQLHVGDRAVGGGLRLIGSSSSWRRVRELAFTPDGGHLVAGFEDRQLRLWECAQGEFQAVVTQWGHDERVNSVVAWPTGKPAMVVSGSHDGTIRFWNLNAPRERELGSLAAWQSQAGGEAGSWQVDWLAYTPGGAFDASYDGARFIRRIGERDESFDQAVEEARTSDLVGQIARGESPVKEWPRDRPPRIAIEQPSKPTSDSRQSRITIQYDPDIEDLRLYQNGVPIPLIDVERGPIEAPDPGGSVTVRVALRQGRNELYAMGTRPGTIDGCSKPIQIYSTAQEVPGKLHVLALGIGDYARRRLEFARSDAESVAEHLETLGENTEGGIGEVRMLLDADVNTSNIRRAMFEIRDAVRDHPEDRVALYLAGHTDVTHDDQFCLLLPDYPFTGSGEAVVAQRGAGEGPVAPENMSHVVTFSQIYQDLVRLGALNRLVIIDACQAEAVFDDTVVRRIRDVADRSAWRGRIAYLMTTSKGEPALEDPAVRHGLMTYSLLRGTGLATKPVQLADAIFAEYPTADLDRNALYATDELQRYLSLTVPRLIASVGGTDAVQRGEAGVPTALAGVSRVHGLGGSSAFPLVAVPPDGP